MKYVLLDIRTEHEWGEYGSLAKPLAEVRIAQRKGDEGLENLVVAQYSETDELVGVIGNAMLRQLADGQVAES